MNAAFARVLNLVPRGQHAADALTEPEPACKACSPLDYGPCDCPRPCGWPSCMGERARATAAALAAQIETPTVVIPALNVDVTWPPRASIADDYRDLRVFPAVVRGACRVGLRGIGTRGPVLVPPPEFGLDESDAAPAPDDGTFWAEFDAGVAEVEAGFFNARRVFHSEDTAGFPAVAS